MSKYIGIDLGGTTIKIGIFDNEELITAYEIPTRTENNGAFVLGDIFESLKARLDLKDISAIGMGLPGPIEGDHTVKGCVNIGWGDVNVYESTRQYVSCPVYAINDANAAAMGEFFKGAAKGFENVVMITIGTGVGGGVIVGGRLVPGFNGGAGEIGHLPIVSDETEYCTCGKKGCLEQRAGALGMIKRTDRLKRSGLYKTILSEEFTVKDIFDLAKEGDELCLKIADEAAMYLGKALACMACATDPDIFIVGGGVAKAGDFLLTRIKGEYEANAFTPSKGTEIVFATLGNDAGMYGACKYAMDRTVYGR